MLLAAESLILILLNFLLTLLILNLSSSAISQQPFKVFIKWTKVNILDITMFQMFMTFFRCTFCLSNLNPIRGFITRSLKSTLLHKRLQHVQKIVINLNLSFSKRWVKADPNCELIFKKTFQKISDQVFFSGQIPRVTDFETNDTRLKLKQQKSFSQDPLFDDTSLLIETGKGPVILTGCAHSGIVNVMKHFEKMTGHRQFHAVIGGTHLGFLNSKNQLEKTMDAFEEYGLNLIAVSHCTGNEASATCYNRFREKFAFANAGWSIEF